MNNLPYNAIIKTFAYSPVYDMYDQLERFPIKLRTLFEMDTVGSLPPLAVCLGIAVCGISRSVGIGLYWCFSKREEIQNMYFI